MKSLSRSRSSSVLSSNAKYTALAPSLFSQRVVAAPDELGNHGPDLAEPLADGEPADVAVMDALADHGELEDREALVPVEVRELGAGARRIALGQGGPRRVAGYLGGGRRDGVVQTTPALPVQVEKAEIAERIAERGHLPVQDGQDPRGIGAIDDRVIQPEVAVHDRGLTCGGDPGREPPPEPVEAGNIAAACRGALPAPAAHLPFEIAIGAAEVRQPGGGVVNQVQVGHRVD